MIAAVAPTCIPHQHANTGQPMLLDARAGDAFFVGDDRRALFAKLVSPALVGDGTRSWCVVIASNDTSRPIGLLCAHPVQTPVLPVDMEKLRITPDPVAWSGRR